MKITSGTDYRIMGCSKKYLYCGTEIGYGIEGINLYVVNVDTKKKKYLTDNVANIVVSGGKILTNHFAGDFGNAPIFIFNVNGYGRKELLMDARERLKMEKFIIIK